MEEHRSAMAGHSGKEWPDTFNGQIFVDKRMLFT
jgi:hypothetical protein